MTTPDATGRPDRSTLAPLPPPPRHRLLGSPARTIAAAMLRLGWRIDVRHPGHVPPAGPVLLAANHIGFLDGPLLAIVGPRPVHALTKREMFAGRMGPLLRASGQIPVDRFGVDVAAIRRAARVLAEGRVVGMFPEGTRGAGEMASVHGGTAYLALVTGAPVVPVGFLGTRVPGGGNSSIPPVRSRLVLTYGEPIYIEQVPWPRRQDRVRALSDTIRAAVVATVDEARAATGLSLPGPLPTTDEDFE